MFMTVAHLGVNIFALLDCCGGFLRNKFGSCIQKLFFENHF